MMGAGSTQPSGPYRSFGDLLRRYREASGLSQEALAAHAELSPRGLVYLERGKHRPYPRTVLRLADALSLTVEERAALLQAARADVPAPPVAPQSGASPSPAGDPLAPPGEPSAVVDVTTRTGTTAEATPPHNLPASMSSFIGREHGRARVYDLLAAHRLVTLVGMGGVGKTRLALAVAEAVIADYPDGVWLVELAPLADPRLVPGTVALALHLHEEPGRPILETLCSQCTGKRLLLVLDNCEHLVAACAALAGTLLRAAPGLRILATSRQALGVAGERHYRVPPLSVPDPEHLPSPGLAGSYEAVRLFVVRAQERRDTFALTETNARAVAEICARLDGVPLAIELAAARVAVMSVEMIAAHLHDRFRLLSTGSGDLPARQRTLRSTLEWSWDLLDVRERKLLNRLSVFAGGWTLEAAAGCAGQEMDYWAVVDGLEALVHRSLVQMDESPAGAVRYRLLESARHYAADQLAAAGEEATTHDSHLSYFLALAEQAVNAFRGPELGTWLDRLETEHDNMRAALSWARARARGEEGLQLAAALAPFWEFRGHIAEGRRRLEELLAAFPGSPRVRARALNAAGFLVLRGGEHQAALVLYQESLALRRALNDTLGMAVTLTNIGNAHVEWGAYEQAEPAYAEALELYRALGDLSGVATAYNNQAEATRGLGQYERADALATESLALRRAQGDRRGVAESLNNLAQAASLQGRHEWAATLFREGLLLSREVGDLIRLLEALEGLAWVAVAQGQPRWAARQGGAAEAERRRLGLPQGVPEREFRDRAIQAMRAALGEETFAVAWAEGRALTLVEAIAFALAGDIDAPRN